MPALLTSGGAVQLLAALEHAVAGHDEPFKVLVVEWLRRHELLHAMPMVVYTARDLDDSDRRRLRLGPTTQFVTKGRITSSDLEQRVMGLLGRLTPATRRENTR